MSIKRNDSKEFSRLAEAFGLNAFDAAARILEEVRLGKQLPRWLRRAARAITRRSQAS